MAKIWLVTAERMLVNGDHVLHEMDDHFVVGKIRSLAPIDV